MHTYETVSLIKLRRRPTKLELQLEDLKGSMIHCSDLSKNIFLISYLHSGLIKLDPKNLQILSFSFLKGLSDIQFINDHECIGIIQNFRDEESIHKPINYSVLRINCELLEKNKDVRNSIGVVELYRTTEQIKEVKYKESDGLQRIVLLLLNCDIIEIKHEINTSHNKYFASKKTEHIILNGEDLDPVNQIQNRLNKTQEVIPTEEFQEDNGEVFFVYFLTKGR